MIFNRKKIKEIELRISKLEEYVQNLEKLQEESQRKKKKDYYIGWFYPFDKYIDIEEDSNEKRD